MRRTAADIGQRIRDYGVIDLMEEGTVCTDDLTVDQMLQEARNLYNRFDDAADALITFAWNQEVD